MSLIPSDEGRQAYIDCEYTTGLYCRHDKVIADAIEVLKEQENDLLVQHEEGFHEGYGLALSELNGKGFEKVVRCKDCKRRGDKHKCILAFVANKQDFPVRFYDSNGNWFCADGKRKED